MKFISLLLTTIFVCLCPALRAQMTIGPIAGINFTTITGGISSFDYDHYIGAKIGATADVPLCTNFFLSPELCYSEKSYKFTFTAPYPVDSGFVNAYVNDQVNLGYIELPVSVKKIFPSGFHVEGGMFAAYQVFQKFIEQTNLPADSFFRGPSIATSNVISAKRFQTGFQGGIGCTKSGFDLSLEAQYHLTSLFDAPSITGYSKQHLINVAICLAYHFNLQKKGY